ncbi:MULTISPECIES: YHYH domain-containing protein [Corallococcus]|uniref:YHYH domain-containing protein n=1 Tax=Corallococcus TaxID=83461 RepID=UPI001376D9FC|nr:MULTISPECIES: YHYH domain-containing protein [Corallococcus]NBD13415.1 YHYH domain-containing protein [Corallococcus silvisoli]
MRLDKKTWLGMTVITGLVCSHFAWAHPGRTNSSGCHNERRTGGYHCHGGGGWSAPAAAAAPAPTRIQVIAIPRARVWINGTFVGMSPTPVVRVEGTKKVQVLLEHAALGRHETTTTLDAGETTLLTVRW